MRYSFASVMYVNKGVNGGTIQDYDFSWSQTLLVSTAAIHTKYILVFQAVQGCCLVSKTNPTSCLSSVAHETLYSTFVLFTQIKKASAVWLVGIFSVLVQVKKRNVLLINCLHNNSKITSFQDGFGDILHFACFQQEKYKKTSMNCFY